MFFRISTLIVFSALLTSGCSDHKSKTSTVIVKSLGFAEQNCQEPYQTYFTGTILPLIHSTPEAESNTVTLNLYKTSTTPNSFYRFSEHCMFGGSKRCQGVNQVSYQKSNFSPFENFLAVSGEFIVIDQQYSSLFESIRYDNLSSLGLRTEDKKYISGRTIFELPTKDSLSVLGRSILSDQVKPGRIFLALIDDEGRGNTYQLYKIRVEELGVNDSIKLRYQKLAEVDTNTYRNYYCSKQTEIKASARTQGEELFIFNSSGDDLFSTFSVTKGVNGYDGRFIGEYPDLNFDFFPGCRESSGIRCITMSIKGASSDLTSIVETKLTTVDQVDLSSWPKNYNLVHRTGWETLKTNFVYLFSEESTFKKLKGAIQIVDVDPDGKWAKVRWKRVSLDYTAQ